MGENIIAMVNSDAKGEDTACMVNNGANPSDNNSGRSLQDGSTEREAEINVCVIESLCLNDQLVNYC